MQEFRVKTSSRTQFVDITSEVRSAIAEEGVGDGLCLVFCPHTTAAITINENADPSVQSDIQAELNKLVPRDDNYRHVEGNSDAHIKSSLIGCSERVIVEGGRPVLG
ncbi:MAG: secondary thiamine-phosphate synthase enzyme YjbQ, partial [Planctomycetota bacterium]